MKLLKKLTFVFSLFMGAMLLYVPASAASEDSGNPEVISYTGTTGGNTAAFLKDTSTDRIIITNLLLEQHHHIRIQEQ